MYKHLTFLVLLFGIKIWFERILLLGDGNKEIRLNQILYT